MRIIHILFLLSFNICSQAQGVLLKPTLGAGFSPEFPNLEWTYSFQFENTWKNDESEVTVQFDTLGNCDYRYRKFSVSKENELSEQLTAMLTKIGRDTFLSLIEEGAERAVSIYGFQRRKKAFLLLSIRDPFGLENSDAVFDYLLKMQSSDAFYLDTSTFRLISEGQRLNFPIKQVGSCQEFDIVENGKQKQVSVSTYKDVYAEYPCLFNGIIPDGEPRDFVEQSAQFPDVEGGLMKYLQDNILWTSEPCNVQGRIILRFIVEKDGSLSHFEVLRSIHPAFDQAAIAALKKIPNWIPAKQNGKLVRQRYTLPVMIH